MSNEQAKANQEKVKELMENAEKVRLGTDLQSSVYIDYTALSGTKYTGSILFKRPSMKDYMKMGALKSEHLRQVGVVDITLVDPAIKEMAQIMATLTVLVIKRPEWLASLESIEDIDLLFHVYAQYEVWESTFRKSDKAEPEGDSRTTDGKEAVDS